MKVALCVSLIFLLNLIILHKIVAKPVDELESKNFTTSTDKTDLETFTNQSSSDTTIIIEATTSAGDVSNQSISVVDTITIDTIVTTIADSDVTTISQLDTTISQFDTTFGNDTLMISTTGAIQVHETTTTPIPDQSGPRGQVEFRVVVSPETLQVQHGRTHELTCTVYGADASTSIYWIQEEPERRYALMDAADANDKQVTMSQVSLRARITIDDSSKIGKYTCMAQDAAGNSGSTTFTLQESSGYYPQSVYPGDTSRPSSGHGYLRIVVPHMVEGDYVEIQCEGAAPENEGSIEWYFNNRLLSDEPPLHPRGKTLHIRPISSSYLGNYRCSIPGGSYVDANNILTFGGQPGHSVQPIFSPSSPLTIDEGASQFIQPSTGYDRAYWTRADGQTLPSDIYQYGNGLQITNARSDHTGTYYCELYQADGAHIKVPYEIRVRASDRHHVSSVSIQPSRIHLKEGQRMIVQYRIISKEQIQIIWHRLTDQGYQSMPSFFTIEPNRLVLHRATPDAAGTYRITVKNSYGEDQQELQINVDSRRHHHHHHHHQQQQQQQEHVEVTVEPTEVSIGRGEKATITCHVKGAQEYRVTWNKYAHDTSLPNYAHQEGNSIIIAPKDDSPAEQMHLRCQVDVPGQAQPYHAYTTVNIRGGNEWSKKK